MNEQSPPLIVLYNIKKELIMVNEHENLEPKNRFKDEQPLPDPAIHESRSERGPEIMHEYDEVHPERNIPEEVVTEENDEPAGLAIHWAIMIAIGVLLAIYFFFFM